MSLAPILNSAYVVAFVPSFSDCKSSGVRVTASRTWEFLC